MAHGVADDLPVKRALILTAFHISIIAFRDAFRQARVARLVRPAPSCCGTQSLEAQPDGCSCLWARSTVSLRRASESGPIRDGPAGQPHVLNAVSQLFAISDWALRSDKPLLVHRARWSLFSNRSFS